MAGGLLSSCPRRVGDVVASPRPFFSAAGNDGQLSNLPATWLHNEQSEGNTLPVWESRFGQSAFVLPSR